MTYEDQVPTPGETSPVISASGHPAWELLWKQDGEGDAGNGCVGVFQLPPSGKRSQGWTWRNLGTVLDSGTFRRAFLEDAKKPVYHLEYMESSRMPGTNLHGHYLDFPLKKSIFATYTVTIERSLIRYFHD